MLKKILKNNVLIYLVIRYFTYAIQFLLSIFLAIKLSPYYFGIWSYLLLILSYFQICNLGIPNSINVLIIQNKNSKKESDKYSSNALFLTTLIGFIIMIIGTLIYLFGDFLFIKFKVKNSFLFICVIAIILQFNNLFMTVFRVKNKLKQIVIYQSSIPLFSFIAIFIFTEKILLYVLLGIYLTCHLFSLYLFTKEKLISISFRLEKKIISQILRKGLYLFFFNISFQLLIISLRTIVSIFNNVEEFGMFNFSYTISNSIILLLEAFAFILFPKIIDKFNNNDDNYVKRLIDIVSNCYVTVVNLLVYISIICFPFLIKFIPNYSDAFLGLNLAAISLIFNSQLMGYNAFLIAKNEEKKLAKFSFIALLINCLTAIFIIKVIKINYNWAFISLIVSYLFIYINFIYLTYENLGINFNLKDLINKLIPFKILIPVVTAIFIFGYNDLLINFSFLPLLLFLALNFNNLKLLKSTIYKLIQNPNLLKI